MTFQRLTPVELNRLIATRPLAIDWPHEGLAISLLHSLVRADQEARPNFVNKQHFKRGEFIIKEGEIGHSIYVIESGWVAVFVGNLQLPTILDYLSVGDLIGEMALLATEPRSASVVAVEDVVALQIQKVDFEELLQSEPALTRAISALLSSRLRLANEARRNSARLATRLSGLVAELQTQKQQFLELQEALYHTGHAISETLDLSQILTLILEYLSKLVSYHRAAVLVQNGDELEIVAARGFPAELSLLQIRVLVKENDVFQQIRRSQQPLSIPDLLQRPEWQYVEGLPRASAWLGVPLIRFNQVIGMLSLIRETAVAFTDRDINLAATFTGQAAIALENARLYDRIARFTQQLEGIPREPTEAAQAAYAQLEVSRLLGTRNMPDDIFEAVTAFLFYNQLPDLAKAIEIVAELKPSESPVYFALQRLREIGAEVVNYQAATSRYRQLAALARASDQLNYLSEYVASHIAQQEQVVLEGIIHQWRRLVSEAGVEVGVADEPGPVTNPYVAGNPVVGDLFVGREDILRHLSELWNKQGQCPSVVLYGHRRMGKTSILHNLRRRIDPKTIIVDFNMQRVGLVTSTQEMLYNLALALYDTLSPAQQEKLGEPAELSFMEHNPYTSFDRFLKQLGRVRAGQRFIITVDEFELIEQMIVEGYLEARLLAFWRSLIQTYPWYIMAFAGLHTLQEMTQDYWHPLFGSVKAIPVSFLSHEAAWRLITQPTPDFGLDYDPEAVERVISLTHGQPYLIQLIGHGLVTRFNQQTFEEGVERQRRFALLDIEVIVNSPELYRDGNAYFTGVWRLAEQRPPGQQVILSKLAAQPATTEQLAQLSGLSFEQTLAALKTLRRHDVVQRIDEVYILHSDHPDEILKDDIWDFTVELMRRWVARREEDPEDDSLDQRFWVTSV
jgi:CRP-like cAMP-binding protein